MSTVKNPDPVAPSVEFQPTPEQIRAADPQFQASHPEMAALQSYAPADPVQRSIPYWIGSQMRNNPYLRAGASGLNSTMSHGPVLGSIAGGAGGYLLGKLADVLTGDSRFSTPAAAVGAALGGFAAHQRSKSSNMQTSCPLPVILGAAQLGVEPQAIRKMAATQAVIGKHSGEVCKMACRIAAHAYLVTGARDDLAYHVFEKLASTSQWNPLLADFSDIAIGAMALNHRLLPVVDDEKMRLNHAVKVGAAIGPVAGALARAGISSTPGVLNMLLMGGAAAGAGVGSAAWLLGRHAREDSTDVESLRAKLDYYKSVRDSIRAELQNRRLIGGESAAYPSA